MDSFVFFSHVDNFPTGQHTPWTGTLTLVLVPAPPAGLVLLGLTVLGSSRRRRRR